MAKKLNPFPGIRNFEPDESELFFGRESEIKQIISILYEKRFVSVVGASGCGKSSLIKAGVIPSLLKNTEISPYEWKKLYFRPGDLPLVNLSSSLYEATQTNEFTSDQIKEILSKGTNSLTDFVRKQNCVTPHNWLIYIDQFEEIFRYKHYDDDHIIFSDSDGFVQLILDAVRQTEVPIYVIISIRSDFLGDCSEFNGLIEMINKGNYLVPRLSLNSIKRAISGPIEKFNAKISDRLLDLLLQDAEESPDQLLIMQHAMMRTWDYWIENHVGDLSIDTSHYEAIGTMKRALSYHGEQIFNELPDHRSKNIAEKIFKALTNVGIDSRGTRRPTQFKEICILANAADNEVVDVIDKFREPGNSFLTPYYTIDIDQNTIIDITHESIMKIWDRASEWVKEEAKAVDLYMRLCKSSELYQQGKTGLWINPDLDLGLKWYSQHKPNKTWALRYEPAFERAISFLDFSKKEFDKEIKHKENLQKRKLRFARNFAIFLGIASIVSILFLIIALNLRFKAEESEKKALEKEKLALIASNKAEEKTKEATTNKKIAEQQQIIAEQQRIIAEEQKKYAIAQQEIAIREKNQADIARNEALQRKQQAENSMQIAKNEKTKADSLRKIAEFQKETSDRLSILAIAKSLAIKSTELYKTQQANSVIQSLLAVQAYSFNKQANGYEFDSDIFDALLYAANDNKILLGHQSKVRSIILKSNTNFISCSEDGVIKIWNYTKNEAERTIKTKTEPRSIAYSASKQILYIGCLDGRLISLDLQTDKFETKLVLKRNSSINSLSISSSGFIAVGDVKGKLEIWNHIAPKDTLTTQMNSKISSIIFNNEGDKLAVGCENGNITIFSANNSFQPITLQLMGDAISCITFSNDNKSLAVAGIRNNIIIWDIILRTFSTVNIRHASKINALAFNPVKKQIASCSYDGTIKICNYDKNEYEPIVLKEQHDWIFDIKYSIDGNYLISAGNDKTVRIWNIEILNLVSKIKLERNMTQEEWNKYVGTSINYQKTNTNL